MEMLTVQSKANAMTETTAPQPAAANAATQDGRPFLLKLNQLLSEQSGQDAGGEIAAALASGIVPLQLLLNAGAEADLAELPEAVRQLLELMESATPDQLAQIVGQPELLAWASRIERMLKVTSSASDDGLSAGLSDSAPNPATARLPESGSVLTASGLKEAIAAFLTMLEQNPQDPVVRQLGQQLKAAVEQLPVGPQTTGLQVETAKGEFQPKADKPSAHLLAGQQTAAVHPSGTGSGVAAQTGERGDDPAASRFQHLQRLAYLKPGAMPHVVHVQPNDPVSVTVTGETASAQPETQQPPIAASRDSLPPSLSANPVVSGTGEGGRGAEPPIQAHKFASDMSRFLVKSMTISQTGGTSEARLKLVPEHLGQLDVKIVMTSGQITAYFAVESIQARELLENQLPQLRAALQQQGIQVDKLEVSHQPAESGLFQEQRHRQQQKPGQDAGSAEANYRAADLDFASEFDQFARDGMWIYGSTFDASA